MASASSPGPSAILLKVLALVEELRDAAEDVLDDDDHDR